MPLTGYIIEKYNCMTDAYTCNRLVEEAQKEGITLRIVGVYDTVVTEQAIWNAGKPLSPCDFVINRYKWGKTKEQINRLAKRTYNAIDAYTVFVNKYEQVRRLHSEAFLMPKYCLATAMLPFDLLAQKLGLPFVAKGLENSMGEEIILVRDQTEYAKLLQQYSKDKEWLFEEYIGTSYGKDMRFYSIRGNVIACMKRQSQGDFRANVALGASVSAFEVTLEMRQIAKDIYAQTGLDFLGIDLLFGTQKPYFCEINVMPGIEGMEKATGVNVAREIIRTIKGDFANE